MKVSILVVLYSCEIRESETINTLVSLGGGGKDVRLVIWNNGHQLLNEPNVDALLLKSFDSVEVIETVENKALSAIYNQFLERWSADRYVILDHDSTLNHEYLAEILCLKNIDIGVPLISSLGEVRSPVMRGEFHEGPYSSDDGFIAIGSGLVLSDKVVSTMLKSFATVFDERFYLYGVDTTFFLRVETLNLAASISLISGFKHSLSRLEKEIPEKKRFRSIERSYEFGLRWRYYYPQSKFLLFLFFKIILKRCLCMDTLFITDIIKAIVIGRHYREKV